MVALCVDHPFFSYDDWAMVRDPGARRHPAGVAELTLTFRYNDLESVEELSRAAPGRDRVLHPRAGADEPPRDGFLQRLQELVRADGALLVLDENVTGFRWHTGGAQEVHGVTPDLSTLGKAMANGFALSALAGRARSWSSAASTTTASGCSSSRPRTAPSTSGSRLLSRR